MTAHHPPRKKWERFRAIPSIKDKYHDSVANKMRPQWIDAIERRTVNRLGVDRITRPVTVFPIFYFVLCFVCLFSKTSSSDAVSRLNYRRFWSSFPFSSTTTMPTTTTTMPTTTTTTISRSIKSRLPTLTEFLGELKNEEIRLKPQMTSSRQQRRRRRRRRGISGSAHFYHNVRCTRISSLHGTTRHRGRDSDELVFESTIHSVVGLEESLCFQLTVADDDNDDVFGVRRETLKEQRKEIHQIVIRLTFLSVEHHHEVKERYSFAIPEIQEECTCDCPGGGDFCWASMTGMALACDDDDDNDGCVNKYFGRQSTSGCFINDDDAELCCRIKIRTKSGKIYDAYYLGVPRTVAKFQVDTFSSADSGKLLESKTVLLELQQGTKAQLQGKKSETDFRLEVTGGIPSSIETGMYFSDQSSGAKLMTGVPINRASEWNVSKLGWFKQVVHPAGPRFVFSKSLVADAFEARTISCSGDRHQWSFKGNFFRGSRESILSTASSVEERYRRMIQARYDAAHRDVTVRHKRFPLMNVFLSMNRSEDLVFHFDTSTMGAFQAEFRVDVFANRVLKLRFERAFGTILGVIISLPLKPKFLFQSPDPLWKEKGKEQLENSGGFGKKEKRASREIIRFSVYLDEKRDVQYRYISLPGFVSNESSICLHPLSRPKLKICRRPKFVEESVKSLNVSEIIYPWRVGTGTEASAVRAAPWWTKFLNPVEWINGVQSWVEGVVIGVEIVIALIVIVAVAKILHILCSMCPSPPPTPSSFRSVWPHSRGDSIHSIAGNSWCYGGCGPRVCGAGEGADHRRGPCLGSRRPTPCLQSIESLAYGSVWEEPFAYRFNRTPSIDEEPSMATKYIKCGFSASARECSTKADNSITAEPKPTAA